MVEYGEVYADFTDKTPDDLKLRRTKENEEANKEIIEYLDNRCDELKESGAI